VKKGRYVTKDLAVLMITESVSCKHLTLKGMFVVLTAVILSLVSQSYSQAQEAIEGRVFSGSSDNVATITVNNPDDEFTAENLTLSLKSDPEWITNIRIEADGSGELGPGASRVYTINFDIPEGAPDGATDNITIEVKADRGMVEYPNPEIIVKINKSKDSEDTGTGAPGEPVLSLVDVEWIPPDKRIWRDSDIRHTEGVPGFSRHWSEGERGAITSWGFTSFPQTIKLGEPFEIVFESLDSGTALVSICNTGPVFITMPEAFFIVGAATAIGGEFRGEELIYSCPEGADRALKSYQELMRFRISFEPTGVSGTEFIKNYVYKLAVDMERGSKSWGDGETFSVKWEWNRASGKAESSGIQLKLNSVANPSMGRVILHYQVPDDPATVAEVPPYEHPPEATQIADSESQDTGVSDDGASDTSDTGETGTEVSDVSDSQPDGADGISTDDSKQPPGGERVTPVNPEALNPNTDPEVTGLIREWLSVAEPPENAVPGNNFHYDELGRLMGSGGGMETIRSHSSVEYGSGVTPEAKVWSEFRTKLDSIDHCTLEEYVVAKLEKKSISHCAGRYGAVKDLKGMKLSAAINAVTAAGFKFDDPVPGSPAKTAEADGTIERQEPGPDQYLKKGQVLKLVIHTPYVQGLVTLPDFIGKSLGEAKKWLEKNNLKMKPPKAGSPAPTKQKSGTIEDQKPVAGNVMKVGGTVTFTVHSKYVDTRKVPKVVGLSAGKAKTLIETTGLEVDPRPAAKMPASKRQAKTVARQNPIAGTYVSPETKVSIFVYGPYVKTVIVPDVSKLTKKEARSRLEAAGLFISDKDGGKPPSRNLARTAQRQKPQSGTQMARGHEVSVWFYGDYVPTKDELIAQKDCTGIAGSHAHWDNRLGKPACGCPNGLKLNLAKNRCIPKQQHENEVCKNAYPGSIANGRTPEGKINCECPQSYVWDSDQKTRCVRRRQQTPEEICAKGRPGSVPTGRNANGVVICSCPEGYVWDSDQKTRCIKKSTWGGGSGNRNRQDRDRCLKPTWIKTGSSKPNDAFHISTPPWPGAAAYTKDGNKYWLTGTSNSVIATPNEYIIISGGNLKTYDKCGKHIRTSIRTEKKPWDFGLTAWLGYNVNNDGTRGNNWILVWQK
jgi:beta-lactam-binding protein with PASTA domain